MINPKRIGLNNCRDTHATHDARSHQSCDANNQRVASFTITKVRSQRLANALLEAEYDKLAVIHQWKTYGLTPYP